ncbi:tetratricopeptide repeat protein [Haloimpatiens sp. FM7315]|uniref:tetratricopeptide repeat protein n=1 Tax=Haloimpatiens sp. FM7315 TaxID=3298609 RepID=UPI003977CEB7
MNKKKIIITLMAIIIVAIILLFGFYKYNRKKVYDNLVSNAEEYMALEEYDKAIAMYKQAMEYKLSDRVQKDIIEAKNLKSEKEIYNIALEFMNNKKYLQAIEEFNKIKRKDSKFYTKAKDKIDKCIKIFNEININNAKESAEKKEYDKAQKYLNEILNIDEKNTGVIALKEYYEKKKIEEQHMNQKKENKPTVTATEISVDEACNLAKKYANNKVENTKYKYDHMDKKGDIQYYVIHAFEDMSDHIATNGWYYVDKFTGKVYEWDLASDKLIPLN